MPIAIGAKMMLPAIAKRKPLEHFHDESEEKLLSALANSTPNQKHQ